MKNSWTVEFLNDEVEREFFKMPEDIQAKLSRISRLIMEHGLHKVGMPYIRPLQNKLWEMRAKGRDGIARGIYISVTGRRIVILHVFIKKTEKTPRKHIQIALKRAKEI